MKSSTYELLRASGVAVALISGLGLVFGAWLTASGGTLAGLFPGKLLVAWFGPLSEPTLRLWTDVWLALCGVAVGVFAATFHWVTRWERRRSRWVGAVLVCQTILGLFVSSDFLVLTALELPFVFPLRSGLVWLAAQATAFVATTAALVVGMSSPVDVASIGADVHLSRLGVIALNMIGVAEQAAWSVFAFCGGYLAVSERRGRIRLAAAYAELQATQQILAESATTAERLRIARDLHDSIGHHLMALNLHLEIAERDPSGSGVEAVAVARQIARDLTGEVRAAVGRSRDEAPLGLRRALEILCAGIPEPIVELTYDDAAEIVDVAIADLVLRAVQEGLSNAVRHADASRVFVDVATTGRGIVVTVSDNGRGGEGLTPGNGLKGMRERLAQRGGRLEIATSRLAGLTLRITIPTVSETA